MTARSSAGPAMRVQGLRKSYGKLEVLRGVDFDVVPGSIFALLGSNGAGKTTTVRILATLLKADAGEASVNGFDVATRNRRTCGSPSVLPDSSRPSTRSSAVGRSSSWSPGCAASRTLARLRMTC